MVRYLRRVIRVRAEDSPNVQLALLQQAKGKTPTGDLVLPGVIDWELYSYRRKAWDAKRQAIGLDGEFYEGSELKLYPSEWIRHAEALADTLPHHRQVKAIGVDPAEGGDSSCWALIDELGLIELISMKTPDTTVVANKTIALINEHRVDPELVIFDQGGGGGVHADRLRSQGYNVKKVSFGESTTADPVRYLKPFETRLDDRRERHTYKNRRAQMYHLLRQRIDPNRVEGKPFAIPARYTELIRQMSVIPLDYDEEGRIYVIPKRRNSGVQSSIRPTLEELLGRSPDELDSLVLATYAIRPEAGGVKVGALF